MTALSILTGVPGADPKDDRKAKTLKKDRVQLNFAPRSMARLNALKTKTEAHRTLKW